VIWLKWPRIVVEVAVRQLMIGVRRSARSPSSSSISLVTPLETGPPAIGVGLWRDDAVS
jgi:hypothetical protein